MKDIFSPAETKLLKLLGDKTMTIEEIMIVFHRKVKRPMNARIVIASTVRNINRKCEWHKLHWFLNSMGRGRAGKCVWKDKR